MTTDAWMDICRDRAIREALEVRHKLTTKASETRWVVVPWDIGVAGGGPNPLAATKDWAAKNGMPWELPT